MSYSYWTLRSKEDTQNLAKNLAPHLYPGLIVTLKGTLGAGKTYFVQELMNALGYPHEVTSPTYVLHQIYESRLTVHHFDIYRLNDLGEFIGIGGEDLLWGQEVVLIEWPEKIESLLPDSHLEVEILLKDQQRLFRVKAHGEKPKELLKKWSDGVRS